LYSHITPEKELKRKGDLTMRPLSAFYPQRQFHLLIKFNNDERSVAVLPGEKGDFLVVDQGKVLGQFGFDKQLNFVSCEGEADETILRQLAREIRNHFLNIFPARSKSFKVPAF